MKQKKRMKEGLIPNDSSITPGNGTSPKTPDTPMSESSNSSCPQENNNKVESASPSSSPCPP